MTKAKPLSESKRPRRALGEALRGSCRCPLCAKRNLRVVAYRRRTARLECGDCELRFSIDIIRFAQAFWRTPDLVRDADPMAWALIVAFARNPEDDLIEAAREIIGNEGMRAFEAHARALGTWDRFVEKANAAAEDNDRQEEDGDA